MSDWITYTLSDLINLVGGGTPKTTVPEYWNGEIPWLSVVDFGKGIKKVYQTEKYITQKGLNESSTKLLKEGQIIISARGTVGELAVLGKDMAFNQSCYGIYANEQTENNFLYYILKYSIGKIKKNTHGAVFDTITKQTFDNIEVSIPKSKETQRQIAQILTSLDDKIELNLQMNQTLEAMAQAIFKEWFVNFNFPGFDGELVDGLPKGWRKMKLTDLISTVSITHKFPKGEAIFLNTSDILDGKFLHQNYSQKETLPGQAKKTIQKGDILFTEIRPANRRYAYVDFESEDYVVSTKLMVLRSKGVVDNLIVYYFMKSDEVLHQLQTLAESRSGTFPQITYDELAKVSMPIPDLETLKAYTEFLKSLFSKARENEKQIEYLTQTRDTLLPKLMSGQLEVAV